MKMYGAAFLYLHFGFEIFRQNNINAKVADKMLLKFTTAVNFTNILQAAFAPISLKKHKLYREKLHKTIWLRVNFRDPNKTIFWYISNLIIW